MTYMVLAFVKELNAEYESIIQEMYQYSMNRFLQPCFDNFAAILYFGTVRPKSPLLTTSTN